MVYEWDERRARRAHFTKLAMILSFALVAVTIPALVAITMVN
ncbi:hypothetical protein [Neorhizobium turbinariae]|jgi:hypothetical protein|nr:hypothetical protein [Neorhizobium turbinariae]